MPTAANTGPKGGTALLWGTVAVETWNTLTDVTRAGNVFTFTNTAASRYLLTASIGDDDLLFSSGFNKTSNYIEFDPSTGVGPPWTLAGGTSTDFWYVTDAVAGKWCTLCGLTVDVPAGGGTMEFSPLTIGALTTPGWNQLANGTHYSDFILMFTKLHSF